MTGRLVAPITEVLSVALIVVFSFSCQRADRNSNRASSIKTWIRRDCSATPWAVAEINGFFAAEGVNVEWTSEVQPAMQIPSILRGDNDVAILRPDTLAVAKAAGARITGVAEADIDPIDPSVDSRFRHAWWFINPNKHPDVHCFADLARLPGPLRVSTLTSNLGAELETHRLADRYGLPRSRLDWVTMPGIHALQALKQQLIDVAEVDPPFFKAMSDAGSRKIADSSETDLGAAGGITYYVFRDDYIERNADKVARFVRAMVRAQRWANAHSSEAILLAERMTGITLTGNHYYSQSLRLDDSYPAPWLAELEMNHVIPRGRVTVTSLLTHEIEKLNTSFE
jgi:ABC-type nitrate/sulfonate/bicarbonate transport system substrate-binding protein